MFSGAWFLPKSLGTERPIRYSFKLTKLRLQQTPDGEFFKTAWYHATTLGRCPDYFVDNPVVLVISAVDVASDIAGGKG